MPGYDNIIRDIHKIIASVKLLEIGQVKALLQEATPQLQTIIDGLNEAISFCASINSPTSNNVMQAYVQHRQLFSELKMAADGYQQKIDQALQSFYGKDKVLRNYISLLGGNDDTL